MNKKKKKKKNTKITNKNEIVLNKNIKKSILFIIGVILIDFIIILVCLIITNMRFKEYNKPNVESIKDDSDYVYICWYKKAENKKEYTLKRYFSEEDVKKNNCTYSKYKVSFEDENHKTRYPDSVYGADEGINKFSYFLYRIKGKEYIKNFLTNQFVIEPDLYSSLRIISDGFVYIRFKSGKSRVLNLDTSEYLTSLDDFEDIYSISTIDGIYLASVDDEDGHATRILFDDDNTFLLKDIHHIYDYNKNTKDLLVRENDNIKLYNNGVLLYDFGEYKNIYNNTTSKSQIPIDQLDNSDKNIVAWSFDVGYQYILEYNKVTKKGKIERK